MNYEAKVIQLRRIAEEVRAQRTKIAAGAPGQNSHSRDELERNLARWEEQLKRLQRIHGQAQAPYHLQMAARRDYSAAQSVAAHNANNRRLRDFATAILRDVMDIWASLDGGATAWKHTIKALEKLLKEGIDGADELILTPAQEQQLQTIVRQMPRGEGPAPTTPIPGAGGMNMLIAVLGVIALLRQRIGARRDA